MNADADILIDDEATTDPVNFTMRDLTSSGVSFGLDSEDNPCFRIKEGPDVQAHRIVSDGGRPTQRFRAYVRSKYRYATRQRQHLSDLHFLLIVDYCLEEAYKGVREKVNTAVVRAGDYNFEGVVVFANTLGDEASNSPGNKLLKEVIDSTKERHAAKFLADKRAKTLTVILRTAELWRAISHPDVERQTRADKGTLMTAVNFFSRRLCELAEQFRKLGLEVTVTHRDTGSWTTITRHDAIFGPDPEALVKTDDQKPSSSARSSAPIRHDDKGLEKTDATEIDVEKATNA